MSKKLKITSATPAEVAQQVADQGPPDEATQREMAESIAKDVDLDPDTVEAAAKADEVKATSKKMAEDVAKSVGTDKRPKKKARKHKTAERTPAQERTAPERKASDPLKGVTIDPDENYPKILHLIVTAGAGDERSMDDFIDNVRTALASNASTKNVTVLLQHYQIDGQHILSHHYDAEVAKIAAQNEDTEDA